MPKGSIMLTPQHEMRRNVAFKGLNMEEAFAIKNYCHFRVIQDSKRRSELMTQEAVINSSLLDEALSSKLKETWSVVRGSNQTAVIRNNEWPGFTAFHKVCTKHHSAVYVGDGLKNMELCF